MKLLKRSERDGSPWYLVYRESLPTGKKRKKWVSTGTPEHAKAKQIAAKILSDAALRTHGVIDAEAERYNREGRRSIEEHLVPDFENRLKSRYTGKNAARNVRTQLNYIRQFAQHAGIKTIGEIKADHMTAFMVFMREDEGNGARTIGAYIGAAKHFTSWLHKHNKLRSDPLATIDKPDPKSDRRKERRMLKPTE